MTDLMTEEEAQRALIGDVRQRDRDVWECARIYEREYSKQREEKLREAVAFLRSCLLSGEVSGADHPVVVAALAENGDADA